MNIKIRRALASLILITFVVLINGCDRIDLRRSGSKNKQNASSSADRKLMSSDQEKVADSVTVSETLPALPNNKYGRDNPFSPLVRSSRSGARPAVSKEEEKPKVIESFTVRLSAIFGDTAIFVVDGQNKSVSVGGEVAEMTVEKIEGDQVTLKREKIQPIIIKTGSQIKIPKP